MPGKAGRQMAWLASIPGFDNPKTRPKPKSGLAPFEIEIEIEMGIEPNRGTKLN
jgi:hypothetical protein